MTTALDNARLWWSHNRARVEAALPLTVQERTYTKRFPTCMDVWIEADLTPAQTEVYVLPPCARSGRCCDDSLNWNCPTKAQCHAHRQRLVYG